MSKFIYTHDEDEFERLVDLGYIPIKYDQNQQIYTLAKPSYEKYSKGDVNKSKSAEGDILTF